MAVIFSMYVGFNSKDGSSVNALNNKALLLEWLHENHPEGFTIIEAAGSYDRKEEASAIVQFISKNGGDEAVELGLDVTATAKFYKEHASQAEVWIVRREEDLLVV
jgi:hypothetical protein